MVFGKSTLFKLLLGEEKYQGKIISSDKLIKFPPVITEEDYNNMGIELYYKHVIFAEDWKLFKELNMLGIDTELLYRPFKALSHGERIKILFAIFFLKEEGILLIDEPTNHLDKEGREILAKYLNKKKGYILISHDRRFLDNTVDHIISINNTDIEVQSGNFSSWYENYKRKEKDEQVENEKLKREIRKLKVAQENTKRWSDSVESSKYGKENSHADKGYIGHLAAKMMKTSKNIERRKEKAIEEKEKLLKNVDKKIPLILNTIEYHKNTLIRLENLGYTYDNKNYVFKNINLELEKGDRLVITGKNGSRKIYINKYNIRKFNKLCRQYSKT